MGPEQFWDAWNWSGHVPFLGDIVDNPQRQYLLAGRRALLDDAERDLQRQVLMGDRGITLVCGSPGVGKSTFLEVLLNEKFPDHSKRVSLIYSVQNPIAGFSEIEPSQFLDLFSSVEKFLLEILEQRPIPLDQTDIHKRRNGMGQTNLIEGSDQERVYADLVRAIILPLCERIQAGNYPQYYLGVDDVDYLHPEQQAMFIGILCSMAAKSGNPKILYSARPVAAKIAKECATSLFSHYTSEAIRVERVKASRVIDFRCTDAGNHPEALNPIGAEGVREIVDSYCSGNLREALRYAKLAQQYPHKIISRLSAKRYDKRSLLSLLSGDFRKNLVDDEDEIDRDMIDIFAPVLDEDRYPEVYIALRAVDSLEKCFVDDALYEQFLSHMVEINPRLAQHKPSRNQVDELFLYCHRNHLVRRVALRNVQDFLKRDFTDTRNQLRRTKIQLTTRGKRLLLLSRDPDYHAVTSFASMPTGAQRYVKNASLNLVAPDDGQFIVGEGDA